MRRMLYLAVILLLGAAPVAAQQYWCWNADGISATVQPGGSVLVRHDAALYNCCPDPIVYDLSVKDRLAVLTETALADPPCDCLCCFDLAVVVVGLEPGEWILRFRWFDTESESWVARDLPVVIPPVAGDGAPAIGDQQRSPCLDHDTGVGEPPGTTWSLLKSVYR